MQEKNEAFLKKQKIPQVLCSCGFGWCTNVFKTQKNRSSAEDLPLVYNT